MSIVDFHELDYTKMMCNVMSVPEKKNPQEEFELFTKYKEFLEATPEIDRKKLFRYIPLVYDKNSPLHDVISDIKKLKGKAAELAGFKKDENGEYLRPVIRMMNCENDTVNPMFIRYCIAHKSAKWHQIVVLREAQTKVSSTVISSPTKANVDSFNDIGERLDTIQQELLSRDNNRHLVDSLDEYYFESELQLRPEDIARKLQNLKEGETIVSPPEKKKPQEVSKAIVSQYKKEDEWVVLNEDPSLHPIWVKLPSCPDITQINGYGLPAKQQKFVRTTMPRKLEKLVEQSDKINDIWNELELNPLVYRNEIRWIKDQIYYSHYGYWCFINGKPTFINGWNYDYLNHWKFQGGGVPEYRDRDRKWCHGWYYAYTSTEHPATDEGGRLIYEDEALKRVKMIDVNRKVFMGAIGPKGRRAGDSNKFLCFSYMETQRNFGKNSDIISSSGDHAKVKLFDEILVPGWQQMPFFYKPITSSNENPDNEIKFVGSRRRADSATIKDQLKSKMSVSSTAKSTKLDGGKEFFLLCDEGGKTTECDVYERNQQLKETVSQGAGINVVGFMGLPSTVGEMEGAGGKQYEALCADSFFENRVKSGQTTTGLLLIYISCLEGMEGFVGPYGESVIETPTPEQARHIGTDFGAKEHIESQRAALLAKNDIEKYNEFVRLFPIWYRECFRTVDGDIGFNTIIVNEQLDEVSVNEGRYGFYGNFKREHEDPNGRVYWENDTEGRFFISKKLNPDQTNRYIIRTIKNANGENEDHRFPIDPKFTSSADTFSFGKKSETKFSLGGGAVFEDYNPEIDGGKNEKEWITHNFVCTYLFRPLEQSEYLEDMLMADEYYGAMQFPENNIKDVWRYYEQRNRAGYLRYDKDVKTGLYKATPGFDSLGDSKQRLFSKTRDFIQVHGNKVVHKKLLEQWKKITGIEQMTKYDLLTAAGGCLLGTPQVMHVMKNEEPKTEKKTMMYPTMRYN